VPESRFSNISGKNRGNWIERGKGARGKREGRARDLGQPSGEEKDFQLPPEEERKKEEVSMVTKKAVQQWKRGTASREK